jgi:serine/threonine protein kinase
MAAEAGHAILGAGGFGVVVQPALAFPNTVPDPENAPNNVTKIMFRRKGYNSVVKLLPTIKDLFKNAGHRTTPSATAHTFDTLPVSLQSNIRKKNGFQSVEPDADLYTLRMPYLGIDVYKLVREMKPGGREIRNRSVLVVLDQVVKLIRQVKTLVENGYIHGDVRDTNIMVHPLTGVLTLIDFDWLKPKDEFIDSYAKDDAFGFYSNPPECLFTGGGGTFVDHGEDFPPKIVSYVSDFYNKFTFCRYNYIGDIPKDTPEDEIESRCQE